MFPLSACQYFCPDGCKSELCPGERQFLAVHSLRKGELPGITHCVVRTRWEALLGKGLQLWAGLPQAKGDEGGAGNSRDGAQHSGRVCWVFPGPPS